MSPPRKKALCIGIGYTRNDPEFHLGGAQNDALRLAERLENAYQYSVEVLLDRENYIDPTKANIKAAIDRLVEDAQPGDCLFFHFSGHGDQIPNEDGTEDDGKDEIILPSDWRKDPKHPDIEDRDRYPVDGRILDDELHDWLVEPLPQGCYLNALFDNCHSGTALDLLYRRYCYSPEAILCESPTAVREGVVNFASAGGQTPRSRVGSGSSSRKNSLGIDGALQISYSWIPQPEMQRNSSKRKYSMPCGRLLVRGQSKDSVSTEMQGGHVYSWCACSDGQEAGETTVSGKASGFMVDAFLNCLDEHTSPTYEQLLLALNERLRTICRKYNSQNGRRPSQWIRQDPEFGSNLLPDMTAKIVI